MTRWIERALLFAVAVLVVDVGLMLLCDVTLFDPGRLLDEIRWWPSLLWGRFVVHRLVLASGLLFAVAWIRIPGIGRGLLAFARRLLDVVVSPVSTAHRDLPFGVRLLASAVAVLGVTLFVTSSQRDLQLLARDFFGDKGTWGNLSIDADVGRIALHLLTALASIAVASGLLARKRVAWRLLLVLSAATSVTTFVTIVSWCGSPSPSSGTGSGGPPGGKQLLALALIPVLIATTATTVYLYRRRALYTGAPPSNERS